VAIAIIVTRDFLVIAFCEDEIEGAIAFGEVKGKVAIAE
jgi:hypothetical protein